MSVLRQIGGPPSVSVSVAAPPLPPGIPPSPARGAAPSRDALERSTAPSVDHPLASQLRAALLALPVDVVGGGACEIVKRDGKTFGYVAFEAQPLCVYVSDGHGKLVRIPVESMSDVSTAMTALMRIDAATPGLHS